MKKVKYIFMLLTFVILACTSDEETVFHEVSVSFSPAVHYNTRSVESEAYPGETPFGVWAYSLPLNKRWAKDAPSAFSFMENEVVSYNAGSWLPTVPYQWRSDKLLTFFAYSPAWAGASFSLENGITIANHDICDGYDLMFTRAVTDNNNHFNEGCVSLSFMSAFSKVSFSVRSMVMLSRTVHLKALYIDSLAHKGTFYSQPTERWVTAADKKRFDFFVGDMPVTGTSQTIGTQMMMPQNPKQPIKLVVDIYDINGNIMIADREIETVTLTENWKVGKYYSYTLNVYSDSVTFTTDILDNL